MLLFLLCFFFSSFFYFSSTEYDLAEVLVEIFAWFSSSYFCYWLTKSSFFTYLIFLSSFIISFLVFIRRYRYELVPSSNCKYTSLLGNLWPLPLLLQKFVFSGLISTTFFSYLFLYFFNRAKRNNNNKKTYKKTS